MPSRLRVPIVLALLGVGVAAAGTAAQEYAGHTYGRELVTAEIALGNALVNYNVGPETCRESVETAIAALEEAARQYEEGSLEHDYIEGAADTLAALVNRLRTRSLKGAPATAKEKDAEVATLRRLAADVAALMRGESVDPLTLRGDYEAIRNDVERNEAAGKGDIEAQIDALRAEATRLNEEADAVEAANRQLVEKALTVNKVLDFWKSIIGEDQAFLFWK